MSDPGKKPEFEEIVDDQVEDQGADEPGSDELADDDLGEESDEGDDDHGESDDAGEDEGQAGQPDQVAAAPAKKGNPEYGRLRQRAREAEERAAQKERELNELRMAAQGRQTEQEKQLEQERLRLMAPEEKTEYLLDKQKREFDGRFGQLQFQMADTADQSAFAALCASKPAFQSVRGDVEEQLLALRRNGANTTRENLATYLIGKRALEQSEKSRPAQKKRAAVNRERQQAKPAGGRSDVGRSDQRGGGEVEQRRKRLENQQI